MELTLTIAGVRNEHDNQVTVATGDDVRQFPRWVNKDMRILAVGQTVLTGSGEDVHVWNRDLSKRRGIIMDTGCTKRMDVSADEKVILTSGPHLSVWDAKTLALLARLDTLDDLLAASSDGSVIVVGDKDDGGELCVGVEDKQALDHPWTEYRLCVHCRRQQDHCNGGSRRCRRQRAHMHNKIANRPGSRH